MQVNVKHPIRHDSYEIERGIQELPDHVAAPLIEKHPHAIEAYVPPAPPRRKTSAELFAEAEEMERIEAEEAGSTGIDPVIAARVAELFAAGRTIKQVAIELNISEYKAKKLKP